MHRQVDPNDLDFFVQVHITQSDILNGRRREWGRLCLWGRVHGGLAVFLHETGYVRLKSILN